jgi:glycosyltransferase involved in cell wall biosynthesis
MYSLSAEKIAFFHPGAELYGSDRMAVATVAALIESGRPVSVILPESGPLVEEFKHRGAQVSVRGFPVLRKAVMRPLALMALALTIPHTIISASRSLLRNHVGLVYVNTITQPWFILAARLDRLPVVVHVRESESDVPDIVKTALLLPLAFATRVVCNSRSTEEYVLRHGIGVSKKTSVLYNGKDWSRYYRSEFHVVSGGVTIGFVGRLNPRKGPDVAIRALSLLLADGVDAKLVIAGSVFPGYEWYAVELRELAVELHVGDRVEFRGFVVDTADILEESDVVVVPSAVEPFGTVAAEAMAAMRPTIVSNVQGLVEIVTDESVGLVFPVGDEHALAAACLRLLHDPDLMSSIAHKGRDSILDRFSLEKYKSETVRIVDGLAERPR